MGDINLDLLKICRSKTIHEYFSLVVSHGLNPLITRPTRVNDHGFSLIDHIWCSEKDLYVKSGVALCDVTDHYPVFSVFKSSNNFEKDPYFSYHVRLKSEECRVKFRETFGNIYHYDCENVDLQSSYTCL